jgi:hypothetical protein
VRQANLITEVLFLKFEGAKKINQQENKLAELNPQNSQQPALKTPSFSQKIMQLQKTIGNQAVLQLLSIQPGIKNDRLIQRQTSRKINVAQMVFANAKTKTSHFAKHGAEFGSADEDAYETAADAFTAKADGGTKQSKVRGNGDTVHFDSATDEFSIVTAAGEHRTYFKPTPGAHGLKDNQAYFDSQ